MYKNTGKSIMNLARTVCIIGIITSIIGALYIVSEDFDMFFYALLVAAVGSYASWISSLLLAGFGELIIHVTAIRERLDRTPVHDAGNTQSGFYARTTVEKAPSQTPAAVSVPVWKCNACGFENRGMARTCQSCGVTKAWSDSHQE